MAPVGTEHRFIFAAESVPDPWYTGDFERKPIAGFTAGCEVWLDQLTQLQSLICERIQDMKNFMRPTGLSDTKNLEIVALIVMILSV